MTDQQQPPGGQPDPWARDRQAPPASQPQPPSYGQQAWPPQAPPQQQAYPPQPPYPPQGQNPWGQQYGQPPHQGQYPPAPYGQQPYGQQPYGQPYGQPPTGYGAPADRPGALGTIALVVVGVCALVVVVAGWVMGSAVGDLMIQLGPDALSSLQPSDPEYAALADRLGPWSAGATFGTLAGIAGWIAAIVAFNRRQARSHALVAIIVGIAAPILAFVAMVVGMWPAVQALS